MRDANFTLSLLYYSLYYSSVIDRCCTCGRSGGKSMKPVFAAAVSLYSDVSISDSSVLTALALLLSEALSLSLSLSLSDHVTSLVASISRKNFKTSRYSDHPMFMWGEPFNLPSLCGIFLSSLCSE